MTWPRLPCIPERRRKKKRDGRPKETTSPAREDLETKDQRERGRRGSIATPEAARPPLQGGNQVSGQDQGGGRLTRIGPAGHGRHARVAERRGRGSERRGRGSASGGGATTQVAAAPRLRVRLDTGLHPKLGTYILSPRPRRRLPPLNASPSFNTRKRTPSRAALFLCGVAIRDNLAQR